MRKQMWIILLILTICLSGCFRVSPDLPGESAPSLWTDGTQAPALDPETEESTVAAKPSETRPAETRPSEIRPTTPTGTQPTTPSATQPTVPPATKPTTPTATTPSSPVQETEPTTQPVEHSAYYISGVDTDTMLRYFNEVVLDAEYVTSGNASLIQKWDRTIRYYIHGEPTAEDIACIESMAAQLNGIPGFPGMVQADSAESANLPIHFVDQQGMVDLMGSHHQYNDGAVTFWYNSNRIYKGIICCRTDIDQYTRNSVIKEEIYNGMGPVQDTNLRTDSLIYSGFSTPQQMTRIDKLIMTLLYHPGINYGMNAEECAAVIRQLYY